MSGYALSPDELSASAQKVDQASQNIKGLFAHLQSSVQGIGNQWQGDAARSFNTLAEQIHSNGQKIQNSLQTVSENLKSAGVTYDGQEQDTTSSISGIAGRLGG
ncbi:WXG100 family type VII secretion target [Streptomyces sp. NBC_00249]|uniref:WXG100 family type VII secretion target n=1 Tax=Streptomyces sp. NBC_00249 TaxID=2975690 RepID=UPI002256922A|nr:WXG100 family type VII secretion target [Streptomyces sp. NBC_00249]MCX5199857.1 WXG100 family type VII secretion target [Streptomyces sp. NBC_00249]